MIVCSLAAPACTAGSERQICEGRLRGSSSLSESLEEEEEEEGKRIERELKDEGDGEEEGGKEREEGSREREEEGMKTLRRDVLSPEVWL